MSVALSAGVWSCAPNGLSLRQVPWIIDHIALKPEALAEVTWLDSQAPTEVELRGYAAWRALPEGARPITDAPPHVLLAALMELTDDDSTG